jgi:cytochrome P450
LWLWRTNVRGTYTREAPSLQQKYGNIVRLGPNRLMVDGSIAWTQIFLLNIKVHGIDEFSKVPNQLFPGDYKTLVAAPRDEHRRMRRQLNHVFSDVALKDQDGIINLYIGKLLDHLKRMANDDLKRMANDDLKRMANDDLKRMANDDLKRMANDDEATDIATWLPYTTFDIIGDLKFAESFHNLDNTEFHPYVSRFFRGIRGFAYSRMLMAMPYLTPFFLLFVGWREIWTAITVLKATLSLGEAKTMTRMATRAEPNDGLRDFMTYMMRALRDGQPGISEQDIMMNSGLLIGAGSETTSSVLTGFFFFAGMSPEKLKPLIEELRSTYKSDSDIDIVNTQHLLYLRACIDETLRVYPPSFETPPRESPGAMLEGNWIPRGVSVRPQSLSHSLQWSFLLGVELT